MLYVHQVGKSYGKRKVLKDVSFTVKEGHWVGIVGANGAGKSTLLKILATVEEKDHGIIRYKDYTYDENIAALRQLIGYVPQELALWENLTVKENMLFFAKLAPTQLAEEELRTICETLSLDRWEEKVYRLSGGMKRKLNIALTLIHHPKFLLLDEPTVGIDLRSKREIGAFLKTLQKRGMTILHISHDLDELVELTDEIFLLGDDDYYQQLLEDEGKKVQLIASSN